MTWMFIRRVIALFSMCASAEAAETELWPPSIRWGDTRLVATGSYNYDFNRSQGDSGSQSAQTHRRKEFGFRLIHPGRWDSFLYMDFQSRRWLDATFAVQSKWLFGTDIGRFRIGHTRVPFGFESLTPSRTRSFMEFSLPMQAFFHNRRTGLDWSLERKHYLLDVGYYLSGDLHGDNKGRSAGAHAAWVPINEKHDVLHMGTSWSIDRPRATTDGRGQRNEPGIRWQTRPEAGFIPASMVNTGTIDHVRSVHRQGLEALWIHGPASLQGEYLRVRTLREGRPDFTGSGYYLFGSYVLTGESRPYFHSIVGNGQVGNIVPGRAGGAWELLLRYSAIDLDDGAIRGGRQHNVTWGVNWYFKRHLKLQANQVFAHARRQGLDQRERIFEMRAQLHF